MHAWSKYSQMGLATRRGQCQASPTAGVPPLRSWLTRRCLKKHGTYVDTAKSRSVSKVSITSLSPDSTRIYTIGCGPSIEIERSVLPKLTREIVYEKMHKI